MFMTPGSGSGSCNGQLVGIRDQMSTFSGSADREHVDDTVQVAERGRRSQSDTVDTMPHLFAHDSTDDIVLANTHGVQNSRLICLPRELKDMVIENVRGQWELSSLSKTCFDLREAVLPFFFRNIELLDDPNQKEIATRYGPQDPKAADNRSRYLLQTISELRDHQKFADMLRTLKLHAATAESAYSLVPRIIQAAPKLERLEIHYELLQIDGSPRKVPYIKCNALSSALTSVKDTLENLKISYELYVDGAEFASGTTMGFCSLQQLHRLKTVEIPFFLLFGWVPEEAPTLSDILPYSLTTLKLGDDEWAISSMLWDESLMMTKVAEYFQGERWKKTTPELKSVVLSLLGYDATNGDCLEREWRTGGGERNFKQLCTENGLQCEVLRDNWSWKKWVS